MISYHVPAASHADFVPLELLATVLTQGRSSRLYRRLVDKDQLTLDAEQFMSPQLDPGQMIFSFSPRAGVDPAAVEKALYEELERVRTIETSAEELRKAKNLMLTDIYRGMKTIAGRADLLGKYEIYRGDYKELFTSDKLVEAVTSADILRVARKYLTANNRTVATLVPEEPAGVKQ
jgi:zinc protease